VSRRSKTEIRTYEGNSLRTAGYIHFNPVRAGIVEKEEEYVNSSCGDYYGTKKDQLN
jgi:hypothetical protein